MKSLLSALRLLRIRRVASAMGGDIPQEPVSMSEVITTTEPPQPQPQTALAPPGPPVER